jgi:hypothetical protein
MLFICKLMKGQTEHLKHIKEAQAFGVHLQSGSSCQAPGGAPFLAQIPQILCEHERPLKPD